MAKAKELWGSDEQDDDILDRFLKAKRFQVYVRTYCFVDFDKRKIQLYHVRLSYYWTTTQLTTLFRNMLDEKNVIGILGM